MSPRTDCDTASESAGPETPSQSRTSSLYPIDDPKQSCVVYALREALGSKEAGVEKPPEAIDGNIYKLFAFAPFGYNKQKAADGATLFNAPESRFEQCLLMAGLFLVILIQTFGPIAILATKGPDLFALWNPGGCRKNTYSQWIIMLLAWAFLFCFILMVYIDTTSESKLCAKMCRLATGLKGLGHNIWPSMLIVDAFVNSFASIALSLSLFVILFQEEDAQGVIFDAMSLAFLLKIDDLSSDFGFLGAVWDSDKVGAFYSDLERNGFFEEPQKHEHHHKKEDALQAVRKSAVRMERMAENTLYVVPQYTYKGTQYALLLLLFLATFAPLLFENKAKSVDFLKAFKDVAALHNATFSESL